MRSRSGKRFPAGIELQEPAWFEDNLLIRKERVGVEMMERGRFQSIRVLLILGVAFGLCGTGRAQSEGSTTSTKKTTTAGDQKSSNSAPTQQKSAPLTPAEQKRA